MPCAQSDRQEIIFDRDLGLSDRLPTEVSNIETITNQVLAS